MSYSELIVFRAGKAQFDTTYHDSHGTCPAVWSALVERYQNILYPDDRWVTLNYAHSPMNPASWGDLSKMWRKLPLKPWETVAFLWTCQYSITPRTDMPLLTESLRRFDDAHAKPGRSCHLPAIADRIDVLLQDETVQAVALYGTSYSGNPWIVVEDNVARPYDLTVDREHWELRVGLSLGTNNGGQDGQATGAIET